MEDLIKQITAKVGISPEQAQGTIQQVLAFIKDKLPAPLASQLDGLLGTSGEKAAEGEAAPESGGILGKIGGMFGK
jgi:hypothetical protein